MAKHTLHLHPEPFMKVLTGKKVIEARLMDDKRSKIKVGDTITFINRLDDYQTAAKVIALHFAANFSVLFETIDDEKLGDESVDELLEELNEFYSEEDQAAHGVVGIEITVSI